MLISGFVKNFGHLSLEPAMMIAMITAAPWDSGGDVRARHVTRTGDGSHALVSITIMMIAVMIKNGNGDRAAGMMQVMMMVKIFLVVRRGATIGASLRRMGQWRILTP
jgi:hypothetical protein